MNVLSYLANPCSIRNFGKLVADYAAATETERLAMDKRYGKANLQRMFIELQDQSYIKEHTKPCPQCRGNVSKIDGCNKMKCACGAIFCWLCVRLISPSNPYGHFNGTAGPSQCLGKLFDGMVEAEADVEADAQGRGRGGGLFWDGDEDLFDIFGDDDDLDFDD